MKTALVVEKKKREKKYAYPLKARTHKKNTNDHMLFHQSCLFLFIFYSFRWLFFSFNTFSAHMWILSFVILCIKFSFGNVLCAALLFDNAIRWSSMSFYATHTSHVKAIIMFFCICFGCNTIQKFIIRLNMSTV